MANCYAPPEHIKVYEYDLKKDLKTNKENEQFYLDQLADYCRANSKCKLAGKVIRFFVADGYAQYMVLSYTKLVHIPLMDAYSIPDAYMRGLNANDIKAEVEREEQRPKLTMPTT